MLLADGHDAERAVVHGRHHGHRRGRRQRDPARDLRRAGAAAGRLAARSTAIDAARARMRPVLMTSAAMIAGMIPMALALGEGRRSDGAARPRRDRRPGRRHPRHADRAAVGVLARAAVGEHDVAVARSGRSGQRLPDASWDDYDDAADVDVVAGWRGARRRAAGALGRVACGGGGSASAQRAAHGRGRRARRRSTSCASSSSRSTCSCRCRAN